MPPPTLARTHYIDLADGKFHQTAPADLAALFDAVEKSSAKDHLVVHFHGGLVSRAAAEQAAAGLFPFYESGGAYPVFFFWRSDLWTTLSRNLDQIAHEPIFKRLVKRLLQLSVGKLTTLVGSRSAGIMPLPSEDELPDDLGGLAEYAAAHEPDAVQSRGTILSETQRDQAAVELETDEIIEAESRAIASAEAAPSSEAARARAAGTTPVPPRTTLMSESIRDELAREQQKQGDRAGGLALLTVSARALIAFGRVVARFSKGYDHGLFATIAEELLRELYVDSLGGVAWAMMKKDTLDAFGPDPQIHAGMAFLQHLKKWWQRGRRITLVGHSTGAIYIGNFLDKADALLDPAAKFAVVLLAPACSFEFMAQKLPIFQRRVDRIRCFSLQDKLERGYWEVPVLYPASLLYLVSGLFEEPESDMPLVGMQRYFSGTEPYTAQAIRDVATYLEGNCVWAVSQDCSATRHGGFDEDPATRESLRDFIRAVGSA